MIPGGTKKNLSVLLMYRSLWQVRLVLKICGQHAAHGEKGRFRYLDRKLGQVSWTSLVWSGSVWSAVLWLWLESSWLNFIQCKQSDPQAAGATRPHLRRVKEREVRYEVNLPTVVTQPHTVMSFCKTCNIGRTKLKADGLRSRFEAACEPEFAWQILFSVDTSQAP